MKLRNVVAGAILASGAMTVQAAPILWSTASGGNGHYYEYISTPLTWQDAKVAAQGRVFNTLQGYLATVLDQAEFDFILASVTQNLVWLGGSDESGEGVWRWVTGPEIGQIFYDAGDPGATTFAPWGSGEPNNCCNGESYLQMSWSGGGGWNDHGAPGNAGQMNGYLVEYGEIFAELPEPGSLALLALSLAGLGIARPRRKA